MMSHVAVDRSSSLRFALIALLLSAGSHAAHSAAAPEAVANVRGAGDAPGRGQEARHAATLNARNAILIEHLESWSDSGQLSKLAPILNRADDYFRGIRVVRQDADGEVTRVEIEGELLVAKLRKDIVRHVLPTLRPRPTAVIIVQDDFGSAPVRRMEEPGASETFMRKLLRGAGFDVIDPEQLRAAMTAEELVKCVGGADAVAAEAARSLFADVAIIGRATTSAAEDGRRTNLIRNRGSIALRIVRASDDAIAEELRATGVVDSRDETAGGQLAVEDAVEKLADALISGATMAVLFAPEDPSIKLTLLGADGEDANTDFVTWLAVQDLVDGVEIVGESPGVLRLRIDYAAAVSGLIDLLEDRGALRVSRVLDRNVTAEFLNAGGDVER